MGESIMISISKCEQTAAVQSEYEALFSVIAYILKRLALSLNRDIVKAVNGIDKITMELFTRLYSPDHGDCGILIVCPAPYDQSFMEIFYEGWNIVKQFINANGKMPKEINLPSSLDRLVCKELVIRNKFPILDVVEVLYSMGQPHLMEISENTGNVLLQKKDQSRINKIITPISNNSFPIV